MKWGTASIDNGKEFLVREKRREVTAIGVSGVQGASFKEWEVLEHVRELMGRTGEGEHNWRSSVLFF